MDTKIIEQLEEAFADEFELVSQNIGSLEALVKEKMQILGQGLLQKLVNRKPNGYKGSSISCRCGGSMKFMQHRPRNIQTIFGWITVSRAYYYCPHCGDSVAPYDKTGGLGAEQVSPALAKACCLLAVDDSFQQVSRKIERLFGQRVCDDTIKQVVHRVGSVVLAQQDTELENFFKDRQIAQSQAVPARLYIALDGTTVHEEDGWHEVKVGCVYWENQRMERISRYVGRFENSEYFGWYLWQQACRCGLHQAKEVVYLGDGAGWIRGEYQRHFSRATFIIDWFHASEHIWSCGKELFGEGTDATDKWVQKCLCLLWEGWTRKLLKFLERQRGKYRGNRRDSIDSLHHYISVNEEQMRYDVFRAKGYDVGSGAAEGACKHLVGKRLKQSGMTWSRKGSSAVLALRITWLNNEWEQLWSQKPLAA